MASPTKSPWTRRRIAAWSLGVLFFLALGAVLTDMNPDSQDAPPEWPQQAATERTENVVEATEPKDDAKEKRPEHQIVYELDGKRYDGGKNFYVLTENVDVSTDVFKADIKSAVDEIVKAKGQKISIDFVNDRSALDLIYKSHYGNSTLGRTLTKAESDMIGVSLVAQFSGLLETDLYPNTLSFFPGAFTDHPTVGRYVETTEYNPGE